MVNLIIILVKNDEYAVTVVMDIYWLNNNIKNWCAKK